MKNIEDLFTRPKVGLTPERTPSFWVDSAASLKKEKKIRLAIISLKKHPYRRTKKKRPAEAQKKLPALVEIKENKPLLLLHEPFFEREKKPPKSKYKATPPEKRELAEF